MNLSVACVGLGRMGSGLARNIQNAGETPALQHLERFDHALGRVSLLI